MDDMRFDDLTRAFACTSTRRGALRLFGGALAGVLGARRIDEAEAARGDRCTTTAECGPCLVCEPGRSGRPGRCVPDPASEGASCGGDCGVCSNGRCRHYDDLCFGCERCDSRSLTCVSTCRADQICCNDRCRRPGDGCCTDDTQCGECQTCVEGACVPRVDSSPCGVCGVCLGGVCVAGPDDVCGPCATCHPNGSQCMTDPHGTPCGECGTCSGRTCVPTVGRCSLSEFACSTCDPATLRCSAPVRCDACELCGQDGCVRADELLCGAGQACCDQTGECGPVSNPCCSNGVVCGGECCTVAQGCCDNGCCCEAGTQFCSSDQGHACCSPDQQCCFGECIGSDQRCCGDGLEACGDTCCEAGRGCCGEEGCCCAFGTTFCQGSAGADCCEDHEQCCDGACIPLGEECCPSGQFNIAADQCCQDGPACADACCAMGEQCCNEQCVPETEPCCQPGEEGCCAEDETPCTNVEGFPFCCASDEQCCNHGCTPADEPCCEEFHEPCGESCCDEGLGCCGGACVDNWTDPNHCGVCGNACGACEDCIDGQCVERSCPGCSYCDPEADACVEGCIHPCTVCDEVEGVCRGPRLDPLHCEVCLDDGSIEYGESCNGTHCCWGTDHCDGGICCNEQWKNCCGRCVFETIPCESPC